MQLPISHDYQYPYCEQKMLTKQVFRLTRVLLLPAIALAFSSCISDVPEYLNTDQFLTDVTVIDVSNGAKVTEQTIVIRGDRIFDILPSEDVSIPAQASVLADSGYVVPGFWDMHVHALSDPDLAVSYNFPLFIANGIVGVRDMGSVVPGIIETRELIAADSAMIAPELYVAGPLLDGQALPWYGDLPLVLTDAEDVERELPKLMDSGVDFFKVYDSLSAEAYQAIIAFGADNDIPVVGHVPKSVTWKDAAMAGQRSIEHLSPFGFGDCLENPNRWFNRAIESKFGGSYDVYYEFTNELFAALDKEACAEVYRTMASHGTIFVPTLVMELNDRTRIPEQDLLFVPQESAGWCKTVLSGIDAADPELRESVYSGYA
ncbi:MAG: hypothetical protein AAGB04_29660, partial [Pseudomonadota bacterium]